MSKVQGKQIADRTITQTLLNLNTPNSGETNSGATVGYVNTYITTLSGSTVIGPAEDGEYTDGIFTDFTESTRIGVAVDRFNEMFKLLAPTPPTENWDSAFSTLLPTLSSSVLVSTTRIIGTGAAASNVVYTTTTPSFIISSSVGTGTSFRTKDGTFVFTVRDYDGSIIETKTIDSDSTTNLTGIIRYLITDPYDGIQGQQGFWTGVTGLSGVSFTSSSITPGITPYNLYFEHPTGVSKTGTTFYVDSIASNTPSINNLVMGTMPVMTKYISGVPSLPASAIIPITSFSISNVSTYFYAPSSIWSSVATTTGFNTFTGDITNIPSSPGDTGLVGAKSLTINNTYVENFQFTIRAKNRNNTLAGATSGWTSNNTLRYDGSDESTRLTSGTGNYPSTGWGGTWGTNSGVSLLINTDELQMLNTRYVFPSVNYTTYGGPNYTGLSGTRWVTFNIGTFINNAAFTLNFIGSVGITTYPQANLFIEVKISGATYWVDGNTSYEGVGNPGSTSDGVAAMVVGVSTATSRRITFGSIPYSGNIIVRIGINSGSGISLQSLTATNLV